MSEKSELITNEYAAVVIPTLCRLEHLQRCINSLKANSYAKYTDLYIGVDYPPSDKYQEGYSKIIEYVDAGIEGFANVIVVKHNSNLGAIANMDYMMEYASKEHEKIIFTEDDNEFSLNYLEYMNRTLSEFASDEDVVAVSGYNYPIRNKSYKGNIYFSDMYFAAFGFGTWASKYYKMRDDMTLKWLYETYRSKCMKNLRIASSNQYCNVVKAMVGYTTSIEREDSVWKMDLTYGLHMFSHKHRMVFPTVSKVRNWGYDGSGVNCDTMKYDASKPITHRNFDFSCQTLDDNSDFKEIRLVSETEMKDIQEAVSEYFIIEPLELLRTRLAYFASRILGIKNIRMLLSR